MPGCLFNKYVRLFVNPGSCRFVCSFCFHPSVCLIGPLLFLSYVLPVIALREAAKGQHRSTERKCCSQCLCGRPSLCSNKFCSLGPYIFFSACVGLCLVRLFGHLTVCLYVCVPCFCLSKCLFVLTCVKLLRDNIVRPMEMVVSQCFCVRPSLCLINLCGLGTCIFFSSCFGLCLFVCLSIQLFVCVSACPVSVCLNACLSSPALSR